MSTDAPHGSDRLAMLRNEFPSFCAELRSRAGYRISLEQILSAVRLLEDLDQAGELPEDALGTARMVAPVVCVSEFELNDFHRRFLARFGSRLGTPEARAVTTSSGNFGGDSTRSSKDSTPPPPPRRRPVWMPLILSIGLTVAAVVWWSSRPKPTPTSESNPTKVANKGEAEADPGKPKPGQGPVPASGAANPPAPTPSKAPTAPTWRSRFWISYGAVPYQARLLVAASVSALIVTLAVRWGLRRFPSSSESRLPTLRRGSVGDDAPLLAMRWHDTIPWTRDERRRLREAARELRRRVESVDPERIDAKATVARAVRTAGPSIPVADVRRELIEHVALIDRETLLDHFADLADALLGTLEREHVALNRFVYDGRPSQAREWPRPDAFWDLREIRARFPGPRLLLWTDGRGLIDLDTGGFADVIEALKEWPDRVVLTPVPAASWSRLEYALMDQGFSVAPATPAGVLAAARRLSSASTNEESRGFIGVPLIESDDREPVVPPPRSLGPDPTRWLGEQPVDADRWSRIMLDLKQYLGDDFPWFAACAGYPELSWGITLTLGRALGRIGDETGRTTAVGPSLLRFARLPWFQRGFMPSWFRRGLIHELSPTERDAVTRAVRESIEAAGLDRDPGLEESSNARRGVIADLSASNRSVDPARLGRDLVTLSLLDEREIDPYDPILADLSSRTSPERLAPPVDDPIDTLKQRLEAALVEHVPAGMEGIPEHLRDPAFHRLKIEADTSPNGGVWFAGGGTIVISRRRDSSLQFHGAVDGREIPFSDTQLDPLRPRFVSPDGRFVLMETRSSGHGGFLVSIDVGRKELRLVETLHDWKTVSVQSRFLDRPKDSLAIIEAVAWSPNSSLVAVAWSSRTIEVHNTKRRTPIDRFPRELTMGFGVSAMSFSPDGSYIAAADAKRVRIWSVQTGDEIRQIHGNYGIPSGIHWHLDGRRITILMEQGFVILELDPSFPAPASSRTDSTPRGQLQPPTRIPRGFEGNSQLAASPDGRTLVVADSRGRVELLEPLPRRTVSVLPLIGRTPFEEYGTYLTLPGRSVAISEDGKTLAAVEYSGVIRLWNLEALEIFRPEAMRGSLRRLVMLVLGPRMRRDAARAALRVLEFTERLMGDRKGRPYAVSAESKPESSRGLRGLWAAYAILAILIASPPALLSFKNPFASWGQQRVVLALAAVVLAYQVMIMVGHYLLARSGRSCGWTARRFKYSWSMLLVGLLALATTIPAWTLFSLCRPQTGMPHGARGGARSLLAGFSPWAPRFRAIRTGAGPIDVVAYSPRGDQVASAHRDGSVRLWNLDGEPKGTVLPAPRASVYSLAFSPSGDLIAAGESDGEIRLWNRDGTPQGEPLKGHPGGVTDLAFAPDGRRLVSSSGGGTIILWNPANQQRIREIKSTSAHSIAISPSGDRFAVAEAFGRVTFYSSDGQQLGQIINRDVREIDFVGFSFDGSRLITIGSDRVFQSWSLEGARIGASRVLDFGGSFSTWSPTSGLLVAKSDDGSVKVTTLDPNGPTSTLVADVETVRTPVMAPDGRTLLTGGTDGVLRLWSLSGLQGTRPVYSLPFVRDGRSIAAADTDKAIRIRELDSARSTAYRETDQAEVLRLAATSDGVLAATLRDGAIRLWEAEGAARSPGADRVRGKSPAIGLSPGGGPLAAEMDDGTIRLWTRNGLLLDASFVGLKGGPSTISFSPRGDKMAAASTNGEIRLWRSAQPIPLEGGSETEGSIFGLGFDPAGESLAYASEKGTVAVLEAATLKERYRTKLDGFASSVDFDRRGDRIAAAEALNSARVFRVSGKDLLVAVNTFDVPALSVSFSPSDDLLAVGRADGGIDLFAVGGAEWFHDARPWVAAGLIGAVGVLIVIRGRIERAPGAAMARLHRDFMIHAVRAGSAALFGALLHWVATLPAWFDPDRLYDPTEVNAAFLVPAWLAGGVLVASLGIELVQVSLKRRGVLLRDPPPPLSVGVLLRDVFATPRFRDAGSRGWIRPWTRLPGAFVPLVFLAVLLENAAYVPPPARPAPMPFIPPNTATPAAKGSESEPKQVPLPGEKGAEQTKSPSKS